MSDVNRDNVLNLYHEIYTNLQTEADAEIIKTLNELLKQHKDATFTQVIASLKLYLISVIEMMLDQKTVEQDNTVADQQSGEQHNA